MGKIIKLREIKKKLKIGDKITYKDCLETVNKIYFHIIMEECDYNEAELEIEFNSGKIYYDTEISIDNNIDYVKELLFKRAIFRLKGDKNL